MDIDIATAIMEVRIYADKNGKYHIPEEYHSDVTYGENVKALAVALYSEGVMSNDRIAAFLNAAGDGLKLSQGSVDAFCKKFAGKAAREASRLEEGLLNQEVVMTDATTVTINGKQGYVRNFSIEQTVIYRAMKSKSIQALKKLNFIEKFTGTLVHDHETALYHFGSDHGKCNVHIIRYLRKNTEETKNKWSEEMRNLLCKMNKARKSMIAQGKTEFEKETLKAYEENYLEIIACGRKENKTTQHKYAKKEEQTLLNRLEKYMHNHLFFLHNFKVPFDDNMSERDLRKVKNRQKMAGGLRKNSGHEMYGTILSVIETMKRRKMGLIENIRKIFLGTPAVF